MIDPAVGIIRACVFAVLFVPATLTLHAGEQRKINIDVTTHLGGVKTFMDGDSISFLMSLDSDAYVMVIYQNARGELIQLVPNKRRQAYFLKTGLFIPLPDASDPFVFKIRPPFGREVVWAFASDVAMPELEGRYLKDGLKKLNRSIGSIRKQLAAHAKTAYGESKLVLQTSAAGRRNQ